MFATHFIFLSVLIALGAGASEVGRLSLSLPVAVPSRTRPPHTEHASLARWLVHSLDWGVVSTRSQHLDGAPYGNALSYSDGPIDNSTGRLIFFLTSMDATAQDLVASSTATLTLCGAQAPLQCIDVDPEDPTCAKLSITGTMAPVADEDLEEAQELLFSRHPAMRDWPAGHQFRVWELAPTTMRLLDYYGGAVDIEPGEYFAANFTKNSAILSAD